MSPHGAMARYAGIDYSSNAVDVVLIPAVPGAGPPRHYRWELMAAGNSFDRVRHAAAYLPPPGWWQARHVSRAAIEEPYSHYPAALVALTRVQGAVAAMVGPAVAVAQIGANTWLRHFADLVATGGKLPARSAGRKALAREWSLTHGGSSSWPQDAHDAHGIAWAQRAIDAQEGRSYGLA